MLRTLIEVDLTNVSREEQQELRDYLNKNFWLWEERTERYNKKVL